MHNYYIYILTNGSKTVFFIGVTDDLQKRMYELKHGLLARFSRDHNLRQLVYFEEACDIYSAIDREKQLKRRRRAWRERLIEKRNPSWTDLSEGWFE